MSLARTALSERRDAVLYGAALLIVAFTYLYGLDEVGIPSNGDEMVYVHIARKTAESGHWLPLAADIEAVRNTKPPLLFWQAILTTDHGHDWSLGRLRLPNALYSLATAALVLVLLKHLTRAWTPGLLGALLYLAFYGTYRYGRPLLTDAPEVFWLTLPAIAVVFTGGRLLESRLLAPALIGVAVGIACLYKSFALILPLSLALAGWCFERKRDRAALIKATGLVVVSSSIALALFALWPLLDPDSSAIWRDFVLHENAGKLAAGGGTRAYLTSLLWGGSSVLSLFGALLANAGLLAPVLLALVVDAWRRRRALTGAERLLWIWVIAYFVAFALPSQRSGRYLLPAMPALAALAALAWSRLHRAGFLASVALATVSAVLFAALVVLVDHGTQGALRAPPEWWILIGAIVLVGLASMALPRLAARTAPVLSAVFLLSMGLALRVYAAPPGPYAASTRERLRGEVVFVPCSFLAVEEAHRFLLPGADIRSYAEGQALSLEELAARFRYFAAIVPLGAPATCAGCRVIDGRYVTRGRQTAAHVGAASPDELAHRFFEREVLIESTHAAVSTPPPVEACAPSPP